MSKLIFTQNSKTVTEEDYSCTCNTCGQAYKNAIELTNLSEMPKQTYNACPFCFSKHAEIADFQQASSLDPLIPGKSNVLPLESVENTENFEKTSCSHYLGYLKKRPKNTPIPDTCLTCEKMIKCVL